MPTLTGFRLSSKIAGTGFGVFYANLARRRRMPFRLFRPAPLLGNTISPEGENTMQEKFSLCAGLRTCLFLFSALLIALLGCSGCAESRVPPPPGSDTVPAVKAGATTAIPHVEPMHPSPQSEGKGREETEKEGASLIQSAAFGKIAQQAIPMPPMADLEAQADDYLEKIGGMLKDKDGTTDYKKDADDVVRDVNALALVALAIGLSSEDGKYKKAAPGIMAAALALEKVDKLDTANKVYADLRAAYASSGDPTALGWTKVASLGPVMKAVPNLDSAVKRLGGSESRLKRGPARVTALLAGLAAIGQGSIANVKDTLKPDAEVEWKKECEIFRDAAIKANAAVHALVDGKGTYADYEAAYKVLADTCDSCHKIFQPNVKN